MRRNSPPAGGAELLRWRSEPGAAVSGRLARRLPSPREFVVPPLRTECRWDLSPAEARALQIAWAPRVRRRNAAGVRRARLVAGVDVSVVADRARAAIVVLESAGLTLVEYAAAEEPVRFPYVPGLLSFRECPVILQAYGRLVVRPELLIVDGNGYAHPRRFGLACHLGVLLETPTIGCAKSHFIGRYEPPAEQRGSSSLLAEGREVLGAVVRTRDRVRPVFVSSGHRIDLPTAVAWTLATTNGCRLPEPVRCAHDAAAGRTPRPRVRSTAKGGLRGAPA
jgi:deoxyribonuclease V